MKIGVARPYWLRTSEPSRIRPACQMDSKRSSINFLISCRARSPDGRRSLLSLHQTAPFEWLQPICPATTHDHWHRLGLFCHFSFLGAALGGEGKVLNAGTALEGSCGWYYGGFR